VKYNLDTEAVLPLVNHLEVGIICHALHLTYLHLESRHHIVRKILLETLLNFPERNVLKDQLALASIAKVLKRRGAVNSEIICNIMTKFEKHLGIMDTYPKFRLLQMLVSAKPRRDIRKPFIKRLISDVGDLRNMRLKAWLLDHVVNTNFSKNWRFFA